jgi:hypothetical protein
MDRLTSYTNQKNGLLLKLAAVTALPDTYLSDKNSMTETINQTISQFDILIAQETAKNELLQSSEYLTLIDKFCTCRDKVVSLETLREYDAIHNDTSLTDEQKELLISDKGGCCPKP